jgi:hypothetical protein
MPTTPSVKLTVYDRDARTQEEITIDPTLVTNLRFGQLLSFELVDDERGTLLSSRWDGVPGNRWQLRHIPSEIGRNSFLEIEVNGHEGRPIVTHIYSAGFAAFEQTQTGFYGPLVGPGIIHTEVSVEGQTTSGDTTGTTGI